MSKEKNLIAEYRTSDLNLAAFLGAKYNLKIKQLEPDLKDKDRVFFVFLVDRNINIENAVADYYNGDDNCSINAYTKELSDLRSWLRDFFVNRRTENN